MKQNPVTVGEGTVPPGAPLGMSEPSELTRMCLPGDEDSLLERAVAWCIAGSMLVLLIGYFGFFRKPLLLVLSAIEDDSPVPIQMEPEPPAATQDQPPPEEQQQTSDSASDAPPTVTIVAAIPAEVSFAVPVVGATMIGPARLATAPPINNVVATAPSSLPKIELFTGAENRSDFPYPTYPLEARKRGMAGKLLLSVLVDREGQAKNVAVKESSGHGFLDLYAADWVKRRWNWPAGPERRFEVPFTFALEK